MRQILLDEGSQFVPFGEFIGLLSDAFVPAHVRDQLMDEFADLMMTGDMTIEQYHTRFPELLTYMVGYNISEE